MGAYYVIGTDPEFVLVSKRNGKIRTPHDIVGEPDPHGRRSMPQGIGVDGDRPTASIEFRPGVSSSGEDLVNRIGDFIGMFRDHYNPPGIGLKAGAWAAPEPLGGHIHLGWDDSGTWGSALYNDKLWQVGEVIRGWQAKSDYLIPYLFSSKEVLARTKYANEHGLDYALKMSTRPQGGLQAAMTENHIEFRYPPSWLTTPEAAYCFLGGAEVIAKAVFNNPVGTRWDWPRFVEQMYSDPGLSPEHCAPLPGAFEVAKQYITVPDFGEHWSE